MARRLTSAWKAVNHRDVNGSMLMMLLGEYLLKGILKKDLNKVESKDKVFEQKNRLQIELALHFLNIRF